MVKKPKKRLFVTYKYCLSKIYPFGMVSVSMLKYICAVVSFISYINKYKDYINKYKNYIIISLKY